MSFRNWIETLADGALRLPILEMATERKNIVAKARDLQHEIADHIIKIHLWPENQAKNHWESEVNAWLHSIQKKVFDRNRRLSTDQYFDILWREPFEHADYVENFNRHARRVGMIPANLTRHEIDEIEKNVKKTYVNVCALIAKNDFDLIQEIL